MVNTFLLNFGHPLTPKVIAQLSPVTEIKAAFQLDLDKEPTPPQVRAAADRAAALLRDKGGALDGSVPVVVALHGLTEATALILAELHGRLGAFPRVLALRRQPDGTYGLAEQPGMFGGVLDLEKVRNAARERR